MSEDHGSIEQGRIGWGDADDHVDIGEGDYANLPLFRVTLTRGRDPTKALEDRAQGMEVLCRWGLLLDWVPPKGTMCLVAFPAEMKTTPGGGVIIAVMKPNGSRFKEDRAVLDLGASTHLLIRAKSTTLTDDATPARYFTVGAPYDMTAGAYPGITAKGMVYLGQAPTPANTALQGPTGISGVASPSVFLSTT